MTSSRLLVSLRRFRRTRWRTVRDIVRFMLRRADEEKLFQVASSLTFTTTLSIVPLATTVFGVMTALPVFDRMRIALHGFLESRLMPEAISSSIFKYLDQFSANASSLTIVSLMSFAVTSLLTLSTIDSALNTIWGVQRPRPLANRLVTYWAILTVGPVLLGVSLTLASYLASVSAGFAIAPPPLVTAALDLVPIILFTLAYGALYVAVPNRPVAWRDAFTGAFAAALAFEAAKRGFAIYVTRVPTYTLVYGALASVPLLLLWIYYIWIITLGGALVAASLPTLYGRSWNHGRASGDGYGDALRILRTLYRARHVDHPGTVPGAKIDAIALAARTDRAGTDRILGCLEQDGLVIRTREVAASGSTRVDADDLWLFAADATVVPIDRVFRLFAFDPEHVAAVGFDDDDPLAGFVRGQRLADATRSLAEILAEPLSAEPRSAVAPATATHQSVTLPRSTSTYIRQSPSRL